MLIIFHQACIRACENVFLFRKSHTGTIENFVSGQILRRRIGLMDKYIYAVNVNIFLVFFVENAEKIGENLSGPSCKTN